MTNFEYTIKDELGIHARPAGMLVKAAKATGCKVTVEKNGKTAEATKVFALMGLGVKCGDTVKVSCEGDSAEDAAAQMKAFFETNL